MFLGMVQGLRVIMWDFIELHKFEAKNMIFKQFNEPRLRNTDTVEFQLWTKFGISEISYLIQAENFNALASYELGKQSPHI